MIRLSGFEPDEDIKIEISGIRQGEKLFEELGFDAEHMERTRHPKIYTGKLATYPTEVVTRRLERLSQVTGETRVEVVWDALKAAVPEMEAGESAAQEEPVAVGHAEALPLHDGRACRLRAAGASGSSASRPTSVLHMRRGVTTLAAPTEVRCGWPDHLLRWPWWPPGTCHPPGASRLADASARSAPYGASDATSNIAQPVAYWKYFTGGTLAGRGALTSDVDGDGTREVVFVSGGRVAAKRAANPQNVNQTVWQTRSLEAIEIVGLADLDMDGTEELLVRSGQRVFVLRLADGEVLWSEPPGEMGTIGGVRLADLDGDGADDLFIQECGSCAVNSGNTGYAYRFAGPGANIVAPALLWTLPFVVGGGFEAMTIAHMLPGSGAQVVLGSYSDLRLLDAATGTQIASTAPIGTEVQTSACLPIDVDASGGRSCSVC